MEYGNPHDPVLRQFLPMDVETHPVDGFVCDPLHEIGGTHPGLLQKYTGRALLISSHACAVHCRYCFRRHFPYEETPVSLSDWKPSLDHIRRESSIDEVILSGGDPLVRTDDWLTNLVDELESIPHVQRLRIHSRVPVVIPSRVTEGLIGGITRTRLAPFLVVHINHPNELRDSLWDSLTRLIERGVVVLCQTVLLKGINDSIETLATLCQELINHRVLPYYLHQLDRVSGAAHFEVSERVGIQLVQALGERLPGYAVPRFVREIPGAPGKVPISGTIDG
jgi:EF-P beta-lysylation protein EpmB